MYWDIIIYQLSVFIFSKFRISDLGNALKKAAPVITEKFQLGVEAQFARMLFAVVALFYLSWTTLVVSWGRWVGLGGWG